MALFANSLRCNGASAVKGRPSVADAEASQQMDSVRARSCAGKLQTDAKASRRPPMQQVYIEGGLIRKLWRVETHAYRDLCVPKTRFCNIGGEARRGLVVR